MILNDEEDEIENIKGIARKNAFVGFVFILALLSLSGVPPLAGFFGKFLVFSNAIETHSILVIIAIINSAIGMFYYLRLIFLSISKFDENDDKTKLKPSFFQYLVLTICALAILFGGNIVLL
jgi:NADH-quinone oxidoreductase subunit N